MHEQAQTVLARVLAGDVGGRQIKQVGAGLGTDGVHQHLLAGPARPGQQHGADQRTLQVNRRRTWHTISWSRFVVIIIIKSNSR